MISVIICLWWGAKFKDDDNRENVEDKARLSINVLDKQFLQYVMKLRCVIYVLLYNKHYPVNNSE